jgi:hypothetical protein
LERQRFLMHPLSVGRRFTGKMQIHKFECELWLPLSPSELFPFFADAANLID